MGKPFNVLTSIDTRSNFEKQLAMIKQEHDLQVEFIELKSKYARVQFNSLVKERFTEEQALLVTIQQPSWK